MFGKSGMKGFGKQGQEMVMEVKGDQTEKSHPICPTQTGTQQTVGSGSQRSFPSQEVTDWSL